MTDVLIVDDSAFMRKTLADILARDPSINVIGTASSGNEAIEKTYLLRPDVITMDVEMPGMDGITAVRRIMDEDPTPIIMVSAHTKKGAQKTFEALEAGAIDFVEKPGGTVSLNIREVSQDILKKVKIAARANLQIAKRDVELIRSPVTATDMKTLIIAAASTGGPRTIKLLLSHLPPDLASGIIVIQHMPEGFTDAFAKRLNKHCKIKVKEASEGDHLKKGEALIAPGGFHLELDKNNRIKLNKRPPLHGIRPSADITMNSASKFFNGFMIAIILTGMGRDGSIGIRSVKRKGGIIIVQDSETSVVFGMPKAAINTGYVDFVLPLEKIVNKIVDIVNNV